MTRLAGKVVLLTGAAGGLGRATALAMAGESAALALTDLDAYGLAATAEAVRARGAPVLAQAGDITHPSTAASLVAAAEAEFGALHALCNIAGILGPGPLAAASTASFDRVMHVNCLAQLLAIQAAAPALARAGGGSIVNVASVGALVALPMMSVYCASKAAVLGLTRAVAAELAPQRVRCNALCPGGIDTPMSRALLEGVPPAQRDELLARLTGRQLIPRFATPEEVAASLVFLASDESAFLTGAVIAADGGHTAW